MLLHEFDVRSHPEDAHDNTCHTYKDSTPTMAPSGCRMCINMPSTVCGICSVFQGRAPEGQRVQASLLRTHSNHSQADSDPPEIGVQSLALIHAAREWPLEKALE